MRTTTSAVTAALAFALCACSSPPESGAHGATSGTASAYPAPAAHVASTDRQGPLPSGRRTPAGVTALAGDGITSAVSPSEGRFLTGDAVSTARVRDVLTGNAFDDALHRIVSDSAGSRDALDLTRQYRAAIEAQLHGTARLVDLACGETLCLGRIHTSRDNAAYIRWSDVFFESKDTPNYVFTDARVPLHGGFDNRFLFSVDPSVRSMVTR